MAVSTSLRKADDAEPLVDAEPVTFTKPAEKALEAAPAATEPAVEVFREATTAEPVTAAEPAADTLRDAAAEAALLACCCWAAADSVRAIEPYIEACVADDEACALAEPWAASISWIEACADPWADAFADPWAEPCAEADRLVFELLRLALSWSKSAAIWLTVLTELDDALSVGAATATGATCEATERRPALEP